MARIDLLPSSGSNNRNFRPDLRGDNPCGCTGCCFSFKRRDLLSETATDDGQRSEGLKLCRTRLRSLRVRAVELARLLLCSLERRDMRLSLRPDGRRNSARSRPRLAEEHLSCRPMLPAGLTLSI